MAGVRITVDFRGAAAVSRVLRRLSEAGQNLEPALADIGEALVNSHQERWRLEQSPDGEPWAPLSEDYAEWKRRKRPNAGILVFDDLLRGQLAYVVSGDVLLVGTNRPYGARHQFGFDGPDALGRDIHTPARPWLGLSDDDESSIVVVVRDHLRDAITSLADSIN